MTTTTPAGDIRPAFRTSFSTSLPAATRAPLSRTSCPPPLTACTGWLSIEASEGSDRLRCLVGELRQVRQSSRGRHTCHRIHARRRLSIDGFARRGSKRGPTCLTAAAARPRLQELSPHVDHERRRRRSSGKLYSRHQHIHAAVRIRLHGASQLHRRLRRSHRWRAWRRRASIRCSNSTSFGSTSTSIPSSTAIAAAPAPSIGSATR